jgi:hypothetical protein
LSGELRVPSNLNVGALADAEPPFEPDALRAYIADEVDGEHVSIGQAKRGGPRRGSAGRIQAYADRIDETTGRIEDAISSVDTPTPASQAIVGSSAARLTATSSRSTASSPRSKPPTRARQRLPFLTPPH